MRKASKILKFRRRRDGKTDYRMRWHMLKSGMPRLVIRKSLRNICVQLVEYSPDGDKIITSSNSRQLIKLGWDFSRSNLPAAYLTGLLCARKCKGVKAAILDAGFCALTKGNTIYSALKGALDGGLNVMHSPDSIPPMDRISGKHIESYAKSTSKKTDAQFSEYTKKKINPGEITIVFEKVKQNILKK